MLSPEGPQGEGLQQLPRDPRGHCNSQGTPRGHCNTQGTPRGPKGPLQLPRDPKGPLQLSRDPRGPLQLSRDPRGSQQLSRDHCNSQGTLGGHSDTQGTPGATASPLSCSLPFSVRDVLRVPCFFLPLGRQCLLRVCSSDSHKIGATLLEALLPFSPTHNPVASVLGILRWDAGSFHERTGGHVMMFSKSGFY